MAASFFDIFSTNKPAADNLPASSKSPDYANTPAKKDELIAQLTEKVRILKAELGTIFFCCCLFIVNIEMTDFAPKVRCFMFSIA